MTQLFIVICHGFGYTMCAVIVICHGLNLPIHDTVGNYRHKVRFEEMVRIYHNTVGLSAAQSHHVTPRFEAIVTR